jgi:Tfp pilus assembly protein PilO
MARFFPWNTLNNNVMHYIAKLLSLSKQNFLYWPVALQRAMLLIGALLIYGIFSQIVVSQQPLVYAAKIKALAQQLAIQKNTIRQEKVQGLTEAASLLSRMKAINLANFMKQISYLATKNHLEIVAIKPFLAKEAVANMTDVELHPFQLSTVGEYAHLLQFMQQIKTLADLAIVNDFRLEPTLAKDSISLLVVLDLYGEKL